MEKRAGFHRCDSRASPNFNQVEKSFPWVFSRSRYRLIVAWVLSCARGVPVTAVSGERETLCGFVMVLVMEKKNGKCKEYRGCRGVYPRAQSRARGTLNIAG